ncbi:hypothetical protein FOMPIDRAFT_88028 [Fomitopsis schrenkii]|uniref:Uncharacterized protein n=1 Tax=Fomitopsis schrenkii TaxID=2126942 RepID=S8FH42_FOMSC|nr:hypothetical protein FOMPIDRAFT_88028 [Fomitopsis schrenkii]
MIARRGSHVRCVVLLDELRASFTTSHGAKTGQADRDTDRGRPDAEETEDEDEVEDKLQDVLSDKDDFGYSWDYPDDSERSDLENEVANEAEEAEDQDEVELCDEVELGPEDG